MASGFAHPPYRAWWRPAALLRRLLPAALRGDGSYRVDYDFARTSRGGYLESAVPDPAEAPQRLRERVDELAARGALDEGSGHVFQPTIEAWVQEWAHRSEAEHDARQSVLQQREEYARVEAQRLAYLLELNRQRLTEIEQRLAWLAAGADPRDDPGWQNTPSPTTNRRRRAGGEDA